MRRPFIACMALSTLLLAEARAGDDGAWKKVEQTDDGIFVYMREAPGTTVKEVKIDHKISAPPRLVLDAACDPKSFKKAYKYAEQNTYYWVGDPDVWFTYQRVSFPVVSKRDWTLRYERTLDADKGIYRLSWKTTKKKGPPPKEDVVRVTLATGSIEVVPLDGGKRSLLRYRLLADPGGNIPGWVIDLANKMNLPDIVREIRDSAIRRGRACLAGKCALWDAVGHDY